MCQDKLRKHKGNFRHKDRFSGGDSDWVLLQQTSNLSGSSVRQSNEI